MSALFCPILSYSICHSVTLYSSLSPPMSVMVLDIKLSSERARHHWLTLFLSLYLSLTHAHSLLLDSFRGRCCGAAEARPGPQPGCGHGQEPQDHGRGAWHAGQGAFHDHSLTRLDRVTFVDITKVGDGERLYGSSWNNARKYSTSNHRFYNSFAIYQ